MSRAITTLRSRLRPLLLSFALGTASVASQAALVNGGFETGNLAGWSSSGVLVTNAQAHTGSYSVAAEGDRYVRQDFAAIDVADITALSFWVRRLQGGALDLVQFFYSDATSSDYLFNTLGSGNTDWQFADLTGHLVAGKSLTGFLVYGTTSGPAYLDDFVLTTADTGGSVPEPSSLLLAGLAAAAAGAAMRRRRSA